MTETQPTRLETAAKVAKDPLTRTAAILIAILGTSTPGFQQMIGWSEDYIRDAAGVAEISAQLGQIRADLDEIRGAIRTARGPCTLVPASGHRVKPAAPGHWATVTFRRVQRIREGCGAPIIKAVVRNGGGLEHSTETSVSGVALPVGQEADIKYAFRVPERAEPGYAALSITLAFPDAEPSAAPQVLADVPFVIPGVHAD